MDFQVKSSVLMFKSHLSWMLLVLHFMSMNFFIVIMFSYIWNSLKKFEVTVCECFLFTSNEVYRFCVLSFPYTLKNRQLIMQNNNNNDVKSKLNCPVDFKLPKLDKFYKFHLIDELVTVESPWNLPYGYCSCIGYLESFERLASLKISNLPRWIYLSWSYLSCINNWYHRF